ncbi:MAG: PH domain-containing protein [Bryobacteraceae bacterium]|jgi:hypothetical protein
MKQVFPIIPASTAPWAVLIPTLALLVGLVVLFAWFAYSTRHVRVEVSSDGLKIAGDMYGRMIPGRVLIAGQARVLDLTKDTDYALARRTNGTGLPGYKAGWFRLRNGEKALAFVTDTKSVAYVPTRAGYSVLLSVAEPGRFLEAIRAIR